jgi:hypothetical protein
MVTRGLKKKERKIIVEATLHALPTIAKALSVFKVETSIKY